MGRPRKPRAVLEMSGALAKNPGRYDDREPEPETAGPIGDPPAEFMSPHGDGPKLLAKWHKLIAIAPLGVLTASDSEALATACRMGVEASRTGSKGYRQALKDYAGILKGLGLTPEGRAIRGLGARAAPPTKTENPLDRFTARRAG